jgi:hypothetical protein
MAGFAGSLPTTMDVPAPDPVKLLEHWMAWEKGEVPPGKTMSELKTGGLRDVLEQLARPVAAEEP